MSTERQVFLRGASVDLVLLTPADARDMMSWMNNHDVTQFLSRGDTPMTLEAEREWLKNVYTRPNDLTLGIWLREKKKLIGSTGLHQISQLNQSATFGIVIGEREYWGNGYGSDALSTLLTFAFTVKNLRHVTLDVFGSNPRAIKSYEKCGFRKVGTIPKHIFSGGAWQDVHVMLAENPNLT